MNYFPRVLGAVVLVSAVALASRAKGEDGEHETKSLARAHAASPLEAKWQQECSGCHIAYAPALLPPKSWRLVMAGLGKHFGVDASLTATESAQITDFLVRNGSSRWSGAAAPLRITETRGFLKEHRGDELPADAFTRPAVKSAANCQACHPGAAKGDFNEDRIRIPD